MATNHEVIVVGAGIAGLTATKRLAQNGLRVANIESTLFGGLVININELDGAIAGSGADLASKLMMEATDLGAEALSEKVVAIDTDGVALRVETDNGLLRARCVIVASGARLRRLGIPGEEQFQGRGVSQCADCDGPMCKDADVVVVGGGDSALQEALVLAQFCRTVHVVHRRHEFRARRELADRVAQHGNVRIWWGSEVDAIVGANAVEKVRMRASGAANAMEIRCVGVFVYVGLEPACDFVAPSISRDALGAIVTDASMQTAVPGVYAVGAVRTGYAGMLSDAIDEALIAANAATEILRA
jgi:thioredoxin reductase (NADPH)